MSENPALSICVPTFNRAHILKRNLDFHLERFAALGIDFEIVVADDGSSDGTAELLARYLDDARVRAIRRLKNAGFLDNYAFTLREARGDFAVFLGDDDLLVPERVVEIMAAMRADTTIGMWQAPWRLIDERPGGGPMGPFYKIPTQRRIEPGDFGGLLDYLLQFHVFPEFYVIRRELIPLTISLTPAFIFWPFLYVGRAIAHMAIVFDPEPFANVTAISDDPQLQQGNKEAMREWDRYRGGLEFIASQANYNGPDAFTRRHALSASIHAFMVARMRVALRLLMNNRQWPDAYILHHRLAAFEGSTLDPAQKSRLGIGAALTTCVQEALGRTRGAVVIDPAVDDSVLGILRTDLAAHVTRERPDGAACYICYTPAFAATVPADAPLLDIRVYIDQFNR